MIRDVPIVQLVIRDVPIVQLVISDVPIVQLVIHHVPICSERPKHSEATSVSVSRCRGEIETYCVWSIRKN